MSPIQNNMQKNINQNPILPLPSYEDSFCIELKNILLADKAMKNGKTDNTKNGRDIELGKLKLCYFKSYLLWEISKG